MSWPPKSVKSYPHFDAVVPLDELVALATNPELVNQNAFLPFMLYHKKWWTFQSLTRPAKEKKRPIRYASRKDSVIFSYYRHLLSQRYEAALIERGIRHCPIAYRKILAHGGPRGKCNIDFAAEAFSNVRALKSCCAVMLDISSFFDNIDHKILRSMWNRLLGTHRLPPDHAAVFKAITQYATVERDAVYERLGIIGEKPGPNGKPIKGYLIPPPAINRRLCDQKTFRDRICGADKTSGDLVTKNKLSHGIPQGAPISDLLANIYLMDFDVAMNDYAQKMGGVYRRYSDDILILAPGGEVEGQMAETFAGNEIRKFGSTLEIQSSKTALVVFSPESDGSLSAVRVGKPKNQDGLEYLGFRYNGQKIYIRNTTLAKYYRGLTRAAQRRARTLVKRYTGKDLSFLLKKFDMAQFEQQFGRVAEFNSSLPRRSWTFRTYVKRCAEVFGGEGRRFFRQTRRYQQIMRRLAEDELRRAINIQAKRSTRSIDLN